MIDLSRLPDSIPDKYGDADIDEAISDVKLWNKEITPEEDRFIKDTELRGTLSRVFTMIIALWLLAVMLILVGNTYNYKLSDSVLITLLTTTTIQVLGMMVIILWDLFPGGKDKNNPNHTEQ